MADEPSVHDASLAVWVCVFVIIAGTIVGGIGLIEWNWPTFWIGIGLFFLGSIVAAMSGIMEAVDEFKPAAAPDAEPTGG